MPSDMKKRCFRGIAAAAVLLLAGLGARRADACTGITLKADDGSHVVARTIEWGGSDLNSRYVVVRADMSSTRSLPTAARP